MEIIGRRQLWYSISLLVLVPCLLALLVFGLNLGIDFTGGSVLEVRGSLDRPTVNELSESQFEDLTIITTDTDNTILQYREDSREAEEAFQGKLAERGIEVVRFDQVGPSVSKDLAQNAFLSLGAMSLVILLYIAYAFRSLPPPAKPLNFGVMTIVALVHDAVFVLGVYAFLGKFLGIQIDALIVTAVLTVIGFSVHDTIVVFDRIRENLRRDSGKFADVVNNSINEVMVRSLNTSLVVILVLLALFLFGGNSIRYFTLALLLGMVSGTYSSIFIASPLLVSWQERKVKPAVKKH